MKRALPLVVSIAVITAFAGGWVYWTRGSALLSPPARAVPVEVTVVAQKNVPLYVSGLGTVVPLQTVIVRTQVDGQLVAVRFEEGRSIRANDVLAEIDSRYLRAKLKQAVGQLKHDQIALENAERDLTRYKSVVNTGVVTQQLVDTQVATVAQDKASVLADQGVEEEARVQVDYATIRSPVAGIVGLRQVDVGNIVHAADSNGIATIVSVSPIAVIFTVPERDIMRVVKAMRGGDRKLPVQALDAENQRVLATGEIEALDNLVDPASGTIKLKATFPNSEHMLFPGEFVHARMRVETLKHVLVVPSHAVLHGAKGSYVFVVGLDRRARLTRVETGPEIQGEVPLTAGDVKPDDLIITDGAGRVSDRAIVTVVRRTVPGAGEYIHKKSPSSAASESVPRSDATPPPANPSEEGASDSAADDLGN